MQNVSDDGYAKLAEIFFKMSNGKHIEHGLSRMLMLAVTGIKNADAGLYMLCKKMSAATVLVTDDKHVNLHRFEISQGVQQ